MSSGTAQRVDQGACDRARSCLRPFGHRGACSQKWCAVAECPNATRNIDERFCTRHEDRATYERYEAKGQGMGL